MNANTSIVRMEESIRKLRRRFTRHIREDNEHFNALEKKLGAMNARLTILIGLVLASIPANKFL